MLILIVIAAAVTLAAFVATYQKQYDAEQAHIHDVDLESIRVLGIVSSLSTSAPDTFASVQFTIASSDVNSISVYDITINGNPLVYYTVTDLLNQSTYMVTAGSQLILSPEEEATISLDVVTTDTYYSFETGVLPPEPNSFITIQISTLLGNQFQQSFLPPVALAVVSILTTYSGSTPEQIPVLDGSDSYQPGANATIVSWAWTVTDMTGDVTTQYLTGQEVELVLPTGNTDTYSINLVVTNSNGLLGSTTIQYTA